MEKDFCLGLLIGLIGGGVICANSYKVRKAVKEGQEQIIKMLEKMDEKKEELMNKKRENELENQKAE